MSIVQLPGLSENILRSSRCSDLSLANSKQTVIINCSHVEQTSCVSEFVNGQSTQWSVAPGKHSAADARRGSAVPFRRRLPGL